VRVVLNGSPLALADIEYVLKTSRPEVALDEKTLIQLDESKKRYMALARTRRVYGVNTGFGPMVTESFAEEDWSALQVNLIRSHAMGLGAPIPVECVRGIMIARLASLMRGYSAIDRKPVVLLAKLLVSGCTPVIPEHGGVGASGDLVQLAHVAQCLIGEGEVCFENRRMPTAEAFRRLQIQPLVPDFREGLALINGTAAMVGVGFDALGRARRLLEWTLALSSLQQEIFASIAEPFSPELQSVKSHAGQAAVAAKLREWLEGSSALREALPAIDRANHPRPLQESYSLRCLPQIAGPIYDCIVAVQQVLLNELNSVSDNPIFDAASGKVFHGGNFHGEYVAVAMDHLKIAVTKLSLLCDRQLNALLNDRINGILPAFLSGGRPGLDMGLQGAQYTATSSAAANQTLAYPMSLHSIPSNKDNQDVVSMGLDAALLARQSCLNACNVLAVLAVAAARAVELLDLRQKLAPRTQRLHQQLQKIQALQAMREYLDTATPAS
jgi:histidine ammonia-lyase